MHGSLFLSLVVALAAPHPPAPPVLAEGWQEGGARGSPADTTRSIPDPFARARGAPQTSPLGDLAVRFRTRGEFGGDWTRFRPCDASFQLTCNPGLIPVLQPDMQFGLEVDGTIGDRLVVDVDWDQTREFGGANRFQVFYQGQEGEVLQRVEVGDVTFALPETRFLTRAIPAGNFGLLTRSELGAVEVQTVFAQQQGARETREFRVGGFGAEAGVIQQDTLVLDDADYVRNQFFFLVPPEELAGYPHVDALDLRPGDAAPSIAPGPAPIQLYRMERDPLLRQQVEGYIRADAEATGASGTVRESGWFRHLRPGEDYYVHPSGLWVALRVPLRPDEALAVTYLTAAGEAVGTYNPEQIHVAGGVPELQLLRATRPQHQPGRATWDFEMKQVYRLSGSDDVDPASVELSVSLGQESAGRTFTTGLAGDRISFLRLFGLDEDSPRERVDRTALFQPAQDAMERVGIQGSFLVFPTLQPFLAPPAVPSEGLSAEESRAVLGDDANARIYQATDPFEREAGGLFRINVSFEVRSTGVASTFALGAFGIREGSERLFLGEYLLRPLVDYMIDYEVGVVTLLQPEALAARSSSDVLRVSWEQVAVFRTAPTSLVGGSARVPVLGRGTVDFMGIYQVERELVNRPRFGAEPSAAGMVGARSELAFELPALDAFFSHLPGQGTGRDAELRVEGEFAVSLPNPNISGNAFLDDFDAGDERTISLLSTNWHLGSAPELRDGAEAALPPVLDDRSWASLVWQHNWVQVGLDGDSVGVFEGFFPQQDIDRQINIAGSQTREAGLHLAFGRQRAEDSSAPWWRSVTTLLSPSGADLTQTEFLDFYVAEGDSLTLIIDLGMVSEDAFFVDPEGRTSGIHPETGRPWGLGVLDQEADPLEGEIWGEEADRRGVWLEPCVAERGRVYRAGDPRANCTRGNGRRDTEDLNGNGVLDTTERHVRYVVRLDGSSPFLQRTRTQTGTRFRLYRIPLRGIHTLNPGGRFTDADWRSVQFLRLTVAGPQPEDLTLARMRLVGSRWVKRNVEGVLRGISGDTLSLGGRMEVSPVSILTEGAAYQAPPGVLDQLDDPAAAVGGRGVEFNEKSLGLRYEQVAAGDRVEVYSRFLQTPRNFLNYQRLRLWAVARRGDWGLHEPIDFFLKVGSDPENYYLYRTRLELAGNPAGVIPEDWLPERFVEFDEWIALRRRAEERLLQSPRGPGDPPVMEWSADSTYAVVLKDRARAPNLAAVREISMGVWNRSSFPTTGEIWVNELRLGGGVRQPGSARYLNVELDGGELLQARFGFSGVSPDFQQMDELPSYQSDGELNLGATLQVGRLLPEEWGFELPVSISHSRSDQDPFYLGGTDLLGGGLPGLRTSGLRDTRATVAFRATGSTGVGWINPVLSGLQARLSVNRSSGTTPTTETAASGLEAHLGYSWRPDARRVGLVPGFLDPLVRIFLPPGMARALREAELRWTPEELFAGSTFRRRSFSIDRFDRIVEVPVVERASRGEAPEAWLENRARLQLRPLTGLAASLDLLSRRDVLEGDRGIWDPRVRELVRGERRLLGGTDMGWETHRSITGRVTYQPNLPAWLRADLGLLTRYRSDRSAGLVRVTEEGEVELLRDAAAERDLRGSFTFDPLAAIDAAWAERERMGEGERPPVLRTLGSTLRPLNVSIQNGIAARFVREEMDPGFLFQTGLTGVSRFRRQDGVQATTLVDRTSLSAGSGLSFPGTFFLNLNLQLTRDDALDRRSDRDSRVATWPDVRAGVTDLPLPSLLRQVLTRVSVNSGLQRTSQETSFGEGIVQRRTRDDTRVPVEVAVEWAGGIVTRYRGLSGEGEGRDPTGTTERAEVDHGVSIETRLAPRGGVGGRVEEPLQLSLHLQQSERSECRRLLGRAECVPFVDQVNRSVNMAIDTRISGVEVGGQASLVDRRSFTGLRIGYTQLQFGIWARLIFEAGPVERLDGRRDPF